MFRDSDLVELTELTHAAATDPCRWKSVLERLGAIINSSSGALLVQNLTHKSGTIAASHGMPPDLQRAYNEYYAARNVWMSRAAHLQIEGRVRLSEESCPERELIKTEFYGDFLRVLDVRHGVGGTITQDGSIVANITFLRSPRAGGFGTDALRVLSALMPHLQNAVQTHRRLAALRLEEHAILDALERLPFGVLLIDGENVMFINAEARRIIATRDGISLRHESLVAARPKDTQMLRALLASAALPGGHGGHLALSRPSLRRPLGVDIAPLLLPPDQGVPSRIVAMFLVDPEREHENDATLFARLYGLTPAEASLVARLIAGDTIEEAAERRQITRETARTHLKRILRKTGARRQPELLRRLLQGPSFFDHDRRRQPEQIV